MILCFHFVQLSRKVVSEFDVDKKRVAILDLILELRMHQSREQNSMQVHVLT